MNIPETFPKEGKWSLTNFKKRVTNLPRNFIPECHHYLLLPRIPARRGAAAAKSEGGPMAVAGKENSSSCSASLLAIPPFYKFMQFYERESGSLNKTYYQNTAFLIYKI